MNTRVQVGPIKPKQTAQKPEKSKPRKIKRARRAAKFKSDGWYMNAMSSIGISVRAENGTY